jgi:hypothetical protein
MWHHRNKQGLSGLILLFATALLVVSSLAACRKDETKPAEKSVAGETAQKTFASPDAAGNALFSAAKNEDENALLALFGHDGKELVSSGDAVKDKNTMRLFVAGYQQMHRWSKNAAGQEILFIGADNFAFPVPLEKNKSGQWSFNTAAGKDEVLARRIGNGELTAIGVLTEIVNAQQEYFNRSHVFATKFVSDQGERNGLFWPTSEGQRPSPLASLGDVARALGYSKSDKPQPFNGYYYKMLTGQAGAAKGGAKDYLENGKLTGGFAVVAWPATYRDSGIMSFMVDREGVIYEKDLGEKTSDTAAAMTAYDPGNGWRVVLAAEPQPKSANAPKMNSASK